MSKAAKVLLTVNDGVQKYAGQPFNEIDFDIDELCPEVPEEDEGFEDGSGDESDADGEMEAESEKEDDPEEIKDVREDEKKRKRDEAGPSTSMRANEESPPPKRREVDATMATTPQKKRITADKKKGDMGKKFIRTPTKKEDQIEWSKQDKELLKEHFKHLFRRGALTPPTKDQCLKFLEGQLKDVGRDAWRTLVDVGRLASPRPRCSTRPCQGA